MAKSGGSGENQYVCFPGETGRWDVRPHGDRYESVKVFGLVDIEVIAAGSVFLGTVHEPIKGTKEPPSDVTIRSAFLQEAESVAV